MAKKEKLISNQKEGVTDGNAPVPLQAPPVKLAVQVLPETQKPVKVRRIETMDMPTDISEPVNGQYYIVPLDARGNEIVEQGFMIGKRTYDKVYSKHPDQFKVKKNPNS